MNEFGPKFQDEASSKIDLSDDERNIITMRADLRKRSLELKTSVSELNPPEGELLNQRFTKNLELVYQEAEGSNLINADTAQEILENSEKTYQDIAIMKDIAPNMCALKLALLAKAKQTSGGDFQQDLEYAKQFSDLWGHGRKNQPADFLPDAITLGVQRRSAANIEMPPMDKIAQTAINNPEFLQSYALVLDESKREEFLSYIPEDKRREAESSMDFSLSHILKERHLSEKGDDVSQRNMLRFRAAEKLTEAIKFLGEDADLPYVKELSKTLSGLEDDESARLMQRVGEMGLAGEKEEDRHQTRILYTARLIRELSEIDLAKGGNLAMKFLAKKEVPAKLFRYFSVRLMRDEYFTSKLENYLAKENNLPFLRKLLAENPNQFNTVLDTIAQIPDYEPSEHQEEIFQALEDLDALTPIIFDRYRQADATGKKELSSQIRDLKPKFFRNMPIKNILPHSDQDILVEMVYLAYKPIGMSFTRVKELIQKLDDQTEDLDGYSFPEEGYDFTLSSQKAFSLREGQRIDISDFRQYKEFFNTAYPDNPEEANKISLLFNNLLKGKTSFSPEEQTKILSLISRDELITNFTQRYAQVDESNIYNYLNELKEILGIYFKDHFTEKLSDFLVQNPDTERELLKIAGNPKRQEFMKRQLGSLAENIDWESLDYQGLSKLLSDFLSAKVMKSMRDNINSGLKKFTVSEQGETVTTTSEKLRAYASKNIGSFFAKAAAGICTAEDIPLFERNDHFHINVVENDENVRANIQAYIINDNGGKSLVLRGFNPTVDFLDKIEVRSFAEKVISVGKQFASDNSFVNVYITEQGGWHALSNRAQVANYLEKKYHKPDRQKSYQLSVASTHSISNIFEV